MKLLLLLFLCLFLCFYTIPHTRSSNIPTLDNTYDLGQPSKRWNNIYGHVISTSDAKQKRDIQPIAFGLDFINHLKPVSYRWKDQQLIDSRGKPFVRKYVRAHLGYIAQDIYELLQQKRIPTTEFAAFVDDPEGMGLRLDEFLPIHTRAIQELSQQVFELEKKLDGLSSIH